MKHEDLSLASIDGMRHLTTSENIVKAIAFAVRAGHNDRTAYRFVTALAITGLIMHRGYWPEVLKAVMDLEQADD